MSSSQGITQNRSCLPIRENPQNCALGSTVILTSVVALAAIALTIGHHCFPLSGINTAVFALTLPGIYTALGVSAILFLVSSGLLLRRPSVEKQTSSATSLPEAPPIVQGKELSIETKIASDPLYQQLKESRFPANVYYLADFAIEPSSSSEMSSMVYGIAEGGKCSYLNTLEERKELFFSNENAICGRAVQLDPEQLAFLSSQIQPKKFGCFGKNDETLYVRWSSDPGGFSVIQFDFKEDAERVMQGLENECFKDVFFSFDRYTYDFVRKYETYMHQVSEMSASTLRPWEFWSKDFSFVAEDETIQVYAFLRCYCVIYFRTNDLRESYLQNSKSACVVDIIALESEIRASIKDTTELKEMQLGETYQGEYTYNGITYIFYAYYQSSQQKKGEKILHIARFLNWDEIDKEKKECSRSGISSILFYPSVNKNEEEEIEMTWD